MEKYATYEVYENKKTGEIIRKAYEGEPMEKLANDSEWIKLEEDPKLKKEKE